jgi:23S rRNA (uracil1939-C5)-methyltransferase
MKPRSATGSRQAKPRHATGERRSRPPDHARPEDDLPVDCPHFGACGGCQLLDIPYAAELARKEARLRELVAASPALAGAELLPILAARQPLFWRTSLKVPFGVSRGRAVAGFFRRGSHHIVDLQTCFVQDRRLVDLLLATRAWVDELGVPVYDEVAHRGVLRHLVARVGAGTEEWLAGLVVRRAGTARVRALAGRMWETFAPRGLVGVVENVNAERTNVILGPRTRELAGRSGLVERIDGLNVRTGLGSFAQVNNGQAKVLYAEVLRLLGDVRDRHIVELYAGYGPIGLRLAQAGARVVAIDKNPQAVREGNDAAKRNTLDDRIQFVAADAEAGIEPLGEADGAPGSIDAVVVDPPRRGLTAGVIARLCRMDVATLVYVSCNPVTLGRDLELLAPAFAVRSLRGVDLFPRMEQIEVVARLERRGDAAAPGPD